MSTFNFADLPDPYSYVPDAPAAVPAAAPVTPAAPPVVAPVAPVAAPVAPPVAPPVAAPAAPVAAPVAPPVAPPTAAPAEPVDLFSFSEPEPVAAPTPPAATPAPAAETEPESFSFFGAASADPEPAPATPAPSFFDIINGPTASAVTTPPAVMAEDALPAPVSASAHVNETHVGDLFGTPVLSAPMIQPTDQDDETVTAVPLSAPLVGPHISADSDEAEVNEAYGLVPDPLTPTKASKLDRIRRQRTAKEPKPAKEPKAAKPVKEPRTVEPGTGSRVAGALPLLVGIPVHVIPFIILGIAFFIFNDLWLGVFGAVVFTGAAYALTGLYGAATGRPTWLRFRRGRLSGAITAAAGIAAVTAACVVLSVTGFAGVTNFIGNVTNNTAGAQGADTKTWAAATYPEFKTVTFGGAGEDIVTLPAGVTAAAVTATHDGDGEFIVSAPSDTDPNVADVLVNQAGPYAGTTAFGVAAASAQGTTIKVVANGGWTLSIAPLSTVPELTAGGTGDAVYLANPDGGIFNTTHDGAGKFVITEYGTPGTPANILTNSDAAAPGTAQPTAGPHIVTVKADGNWTLTPA